MRTTLSPAFTGSKMRQMFDFVAKVGKQTSETIQNQIQSGNREKEINFKEFAGFFTVDNIASCAFGIEINSFENPNNDFQKVAQKFSDFTGIKSVIKFIGYALMPSIMKALKVKLLDSDMYDFFKSAILDTIKTREEKGIVRYDMINLLIQAKKGTLSHNHAEEEKITDGFATVEESSVGKSENRRKWDDLDLAAQCFIFFLAGIMIFKFILSTYNWVYFKFRI
jgi:cytochrome P450 family 9